MNKQRENKLNYFINSYLKNRPTFFALIRPQEARLFEKNKKYIKTPILDFGCGDGFFASVAFGDHGFSRIRKSEGYTRIIDVGLDLIGNKRVEKAKKNNIYKKIVLYDGNMIPLPNNYFKTIVSNCVLEHIPNLNFSLKEIYRVLAPGGYFITTVMTNKWEDYFFGTKIFGNWYKKFMKKKQEHYNLFSEKKWSQEFEGSGFKIIKKIGYLSPQTSMWIDILHYLSIPSLLSYKLFKKWVLFPKLFSNTSMNRFIATIIDQPVASKNASGLFYIIKK